MRNAVVSSAYAIHFIYVLSDTICIWHCFLVDKGSDRYASPDTGRAEGECLYMATRTDLSFYRPKSSAICILSYDHPHV